MEKDLNLNVVATDGKPIIVEIREGQALTLCHPLNVVHVGDIKSVKEFIGKNYPEAVEEDKVFEGVIKLDENNSKILFINFPQNTHGKTEVTAQLIENKRLARFGINNEVWFTQKDVAKLIRNNAMLFKDTDTVRGLVKTLDELTLVIQNELTDNNDRRGNVEQHRKRVIKEKKGVLPEYITLFCPLFEGIDPIEIKLEIEVEIQSERPVYSFYCLEMDIMLEDAKKKAFSDNMTEYMYKHFTVLNV